MSDLLPCPFCGGKADIDYDGSVYDGTHVYCTECDIRTESYKTKTGSTWDVDAAIAAWNRRALPAAQPDPREAALRDIARQKKTDEMDTEYDVEYADFEGGYNAIIDVARRALPAVQPDADSFADLIADARLEAAKAMKKFPQPNYVISKVAEEAGEVVKAAIHCAEGRETAENVRGEMRQVIAMLYRLWVEGDQVHGLAPLTPQPKDNSHE